MVNKTFLLMASCIKKSIKQIIVVIILSITVSILLNCFLSITIDYKKNFDRQVEEQNASTFVAVYYNFFNIDKYEKIENELKNNDHVIEYEIDKVMSINGSINYGDGLLSNIVTIDSYENMINRNIDKIELIDENKNASGAYVSYLFSVTLHKNIGDSFKVKMNDKEYNFKIVGFYNSVSTGTTNCTDISIYLTNDLFDDIYIPNTSYRLSVKLDDCEKELERTNILDSITTKNPDLLLVGSNMLTKVKTSRYINSSLFEAIMLVASIILSIVLLAIISIVLTNYVKKNVVSFGTLKAIGYTSNILIYPLVVEFFFIVLVSSIIGVFASYFVIPFINNALESQVGIPYEINFLFLPFILTILICSILSLVTTYLSIRKIKKIAPINAIRDSKSSENKVSNSISFEKSKLGVNFIIGLNNLMSGISRSLILFFSFIAISFLLGFSAFIYQNVIMDSSYTVDLICGEFANSLVSVFPSEEEKLINELKNDERVKEYYLYTIRLICPNDLDSFSTYVIEKGSDSINEERICIDGHMPESDCEIAINGAYANLYGLKINDKISFSVEDEVINYNIVGITQGAYLSGRDSYLTREGYEKIGSFKYVTYNINLIDEEAINEFNDDISSKVNTFIVVNQKMYLNSIVPMYCLVLNVLGVIIVIMSIIISCFVLYILLSIMLENKRREHGILKSIGFISKDIIIQTEIGIIPECIVGSIIGLLLSRKGVTKLLTIPLKSIGIFNFGEPIKNLYLSLCGIVLIVFTFFYIILLSRSVKKISPHQLFNKE